MASKIGLLTNHFNQRYPTKCQTPISHLNQWRVLFSLTAHGTEWMKMYTQLTANRRLTKSERASTNVLKLTLSLLSQQKFQWSSAFKECVLHVFKTNVKVFEMKVKDKWVKVMVSNKRSSLSVGIRMWNMKALALTNQKLKFLESRSNY
jgi:hypothetical protein